MKKNHGLPPALWSYTIDICSEQGISHERKTLQGPASLRKVMQILVILKSKKTEQTFYFQSVFRYCVDCTDWLSGHCLGAEMLSAHREPCVVHT